LERKLEEVERKLERKLEKVERKLGKKSIITSDIYILICIVDGSDI